MLTAGRFKCSGGREAKVRVEVRAMNKDVGTYRSAVDCVDMIREGRSNEWSSFVGYIPFPFNGWTQSFAHL